MEMGWGFKVMKILKIIFQLFFFPFLILAIFLFEWGIYNPLIYPSFSFCFMHVWAFVNFSYHSWSVFFPDVSDKEIALFPLGSIFGFSWTNMPCQPCSFNYYSCIVQFFENYEKSMVFLHSQRLSPDPIVNPYVHIEETRKHGVVKKGLVCQSPRKQCAALPLRALKALFCIIAIFCFGKLYHLLTTISVISETTGLCWNA